MAVLFFLIFVCDNFAVFDANLKLAGQIQNIDQKNPVFSADTLFIWMEQYAKPTSLI